MTNIAKSIHTGLVRKNPAQKGFLVPPIAIGAVVVVAVIVAVLVASGSLKGSFNISKSGKEAPTTEANLPTPTPKPKAELTQEPFVDQTQGYSIQYPKDWQVDPQGGPQGGAIFFSKDDGATTISQSPAALFLIVNPLGEFKEAQFSTIVDSNRLSLKKEFAGAVFDVDQMTKVGNYEAHLFSFTYTGNQGVEYQPQITLIRGQEKLYAIWTMAKKANLSKYEDALQASVESLKIL